MTSGRISLHVSHCERYPNVHAMSPHTPDPSPEITALGDCRIMCSYFHLQDLLSISEMCPDNKTAGQDKFISLLNNAERFGKQTSTDLLPHGLCTYRFSFKRQNTNE